jgi:hypothetical protein|tara:strand:+ start:41 stop:280 length:240 start_codon:yes stop_codon:yes gene_type:complete
VPSKQEIQHILDNITPFQEYIMRGASRMVGQSLDQLESAMPEGRQLEKLKQLIEDIMYDYRDSLLRATVELDIEKKISK